MENKIKGFVRRVCCCKAEHHAAAADASFDSSRDDLEEGTGIKQYRLEATQTTQQHGLRRFFCCDRQPSVQGVGITHNQRLAQYLHWMFRVNFAFLFALSCLVFFALTLIFAGFIMAAGRIDAKCVQIGGAPIGMNSAAFVDAFALSWTTFSTVGYGSTYPSLGWQNNSPSNCVFITAICSFEAFIGVLYSGFCGALLFGKVLRIQSHAQVIFSDPIVIRYGSGVERTPDVAEDDKEDHAGGAFMQNRGGSARRNNFHIPCPVLEFRIANRLYNDVGGEIMDATLHAVANVDAGDSDLSLTNNTESTRSRFETGSNTDTASERDYDNGSDLGLTSLHASRHVSKFMNSMAVFSGRSKQQQTIDEDPSARLVGKRIFSKMHIEASEHPFFKRVWLACHVLDESSPLLTQKTRRAIRRNGGFWPPHLNSYEAVRNSLRFNQILVSLNGVSNVSAADVYAQRIYDFADGEY